MSVTEYHVGPATEPSLDGDSDDSSDGERTVREGDREPFPLDEDETFHLLQCRRRRDALRYLRDADGPVAMRDLAEQVAAWEHDTTVTALSSTERQRVYIPLYQTHLPKLDEHDVVDYDKHRGTVERAANAPTLDPYLDESDDDSHDEGGESPGTHYVGAVAVSGVALAATLAGLSGLVAAAVVVAAFTLATLGEMATGSGDDRPAGER